MGKFLYTYAYHEDEKSLCALEMRAFFGYDSNAKTIESNRKIEPSRSPFMKGRLAIVYEAESFEQLIKQVATGLVVKDTFKVVYVPTDASDKNLLKQLGGRRAIEKEIGLMIKGNPDLRHPEQLFGVTEVDGRWIFGHYVKSEPIWHRHQRKPHQFSTALSTRVARAVVNIAIPQPHQVKAIDPCCGIGTVLIEALSMGIHIVGSDKNAFIIDRVIDNIEFFGFSAEVNACDIRQITNTYDVAIIDLPYNVCSSLTTTERYEMLESARRIAKRAVFVTVERIDETLHDVRFSIVDRAVIKKGTFSRDIIVCE